MKKSKYRKWLLAFVLVNFFFITKFSSAKAQALQTIYGTVSDSKTGETLIGVSVTVKGINRVTTTNQTGKYTIKAKSTDILIFTYVGYVAKEEKVGSRTSLNVDLRENANVLNDVVVIGYGTVAKKDLTGSVGTVSMEALEAAPVISFDQALAGRVAGVQVSSGEGQPGGEGINIVIRGAGSLTQSTAPLYVVDGFANEHFDPVSLNMNDIESISILKDASAIAIYGARAANGVVVIETKKGKAGSPVITYNGSIGQQEILKRMEMMNPYEFVKFQNERGFGASYLTNDRTVESYQNVQGVDWQDKLFKTGRTNIHDIAIRGGNADTKYSLSGSLFNNDAIIINTGTDRYQGRFSLDQTLNKKIKVGANLNYSSRSYYGKEASTTSSSASSASSYLLYATLGYRPITGSVDFSEEDLENSIIDEEIDVLNDYRVNPILSAQNEYNKKIENNLLANAYLEYKITNGLTFRSTGSINSLSNDNEYFNNSLTARGNPILPGNSRGQWGGKNYSDRFVWSNENFFSYKKKINKLNAYDVMAGFSSQKSTIKTGGFVSTNVSNEKLGINSLGSGIPFAVNSTASDYTMQSFFGRVNYNYNSKYLFTATMRADGSSRFAKGNKWGYFPSGAFAWRMNNENFMKNIKFISDAKFRISYGHTGNNRVTDYATYDLINTSGDGAYSWGDGDPTMGAFVYKLGNKDLKWETSEQLDIGYDLSLFRNRVHFTFDYYKKTTRDLLLNASMPTHTGYATVFKNIGAIQNEGLEFSFTSVNIKTKSFSWESNFNISFNKNKVLNLADGEANMLESVSWNNAYVNSPLYITEVGQPAGQFLGYIWEGNYQLTDFDEVATGSYTLKTEVPTNGNSRASIRPGDIKYRDLNGDGEVNDFDRTVIGRGTPIHTGGFLNSFSYKGVQLGVFLQWSYGNDILNANKLMFEGASLSNLNQFASYANRWSPENQTNDNFRTNGYGPAGRYSTKVIEDGSFLRLKTVSLAYQIPRTILQHFKIKSLSINAAAQNLFTWSNYSGFDPEVSTRRSILTPGFDYSAYPHARTIVLGLKVTL